VVQPETNSVSDDVAREALAWAVSVALVDPARLGDPPSRPPVETLRALPVEFVRDHVDRILMSKNAEEGLEALHHIGLLDAWLPEVGAMVGFGDGEWRHKDVWKHTKQVVRQAVPHLEVRWGALLHDIGKPKTRKITDDGEVTFYGHAEVGAAMFRRRVGKRLGFEAELFERIHFLILYHLRASQYDTRWTDAAVRRFARDMGDGLDDLLALSRADITTKRPARKKRGLAQISALATRIRELEKADARVAPLPKGLGTALMDSFGIPPSRRLGEIMKELERRCDEGELAAGEGAEFYIDYIGSHRGDFEL